MKKIVQGSTPLFKEGPHASGPTLPGLDVRLGQVTMEASLIGSEQPGEWGFYDVYELLKLLKGLKDQRKRGCNCRGSWTEGETTSEVPKCLKDVSKSTSQI